MITISVYVTVHYRTSRNTYQTRTELKICCSEILYYVFVVPLALYRLCQTPPPLKTSDLK